MGSRFGGLKQAAAVGPKGEMIIDYSVYDAAAAGFNKAVIIIRKDIEQDFREQAGKRIEKMIDTTYVYQEKERLPEGFVCPPTREKPWGTGHALLCAADAVDFPFIVLNADDYYGKTVYSDMYKYLVNGGGMCMAGYKLGNTLSENGTVARGICTVKDGYLSSITETLNIDKNSGFSPDTVVSMNMWGFTPDIFDTLRTEFQSFLKENISDPKKEFFLPYAAEKLISQNRKIKVINTNEQWYGVTYREDLEAVRKAVAALYKDKE